MDSVNTFVTAKKLPMGLQKNVYTSICFKIVLLSIPKGFQTINFKSLCIFFKLHVKLNNTT